MPQDYYEVLEVGRKATLQELKKAYRAKALRYHPDRNKTPEAEAQFKAVNEAYHVLSDTKRRRLYDRFGHAGLKGANGGADMGFNINLNDIFDTFFGGGRGGQGSYGPVAGADLGYRLQVDLVDVIAGVEKEFTIPRLVPCDECETRGTAYGSNPLQCNECHGSGTIRRVQNMIIGQIEHASECHNCEGRGVIINNPCPKCQGDGRHEGKSKIQLKIPPGVETGTRLSLRDKGDAGERGAPAGNLIISVQVKDHKNFKRSGRDIVTDKTINFAEAALGIETEIETLDSTAKLSAKAGTQHGDLSRIKNAGLPPLGRTEPRGDLIVRWLIHTPTKLNVNQKELLKQLADTFKSAEKGVFKKLKDTINPPK